jgi:hypothetical protein
VSGSGTDILIEVDGEFDSMARIRDVIINTTASGSTTHHITRVKYVRFIGYR